MSVKQRLISFIKYNNIGQKKFARIVGVSDGYVNAIRVSIQPDTVHKIAMQFPELNTGWLLTGQGKMLYDNTNEGKIIENKVVEVQSNPKDVKLIESQQDIISLQKSHITALDEFNEFLQRRVIELESTLNGSRVDYARHSPKMLKAAERRATFTVDPPKKEDEDK